MPLSAWDEYRLLKARDELLDARDTLRAREEAEAEALRPPMPRWDGNAAGLPILEDTPLAAYRRGELPLSALEPSDFLQPDGAAVTSTAAAPPPRARSVAAIASRLSLDCDHVSHCAVRRLCERVARGLPEPARVPSQAHAQRQQQQQQQWRPLPRPAAPPASAHAAHDPADPLSHSGHAFGRRPEMGSSSSHDISATGVAPAGELAGEAVRAAEMARDRTGSSYDSGGGGIGHHGWGVPWDIGLPVTRPLTGRPPPPPRTDLWLPPTHVHAAPTAGEAEVPPPPRSAAAPAVDAGEGAADVAALLTWAQDLDTEWMDHV